MLAIAVAGRGPLVCVAKGGSKGGECLPSTPLSALLQSSIASAARLRRPARPRLLSVLAGGASKGGGGKSSGSGGAKGGGAGKTPMTQEAASRIQVCRSNFGRRGIACTGSLEASMARQAKALPITVGWQLSRHLIPQSAEARQHGGQVDKGSFASRAQASTAIAI